MLIPYYMGDGIFLETIFNTKSIIRETVNIFKTNNYIGYP